MTLSSHKSIYKAQNYFAFSTAGIEKNNSDTFTTTELPLNKSTFLLEISMLGSGKDTRYFVKAVK